MSKKYINNGYTDKISYYNGEYIKVYADGYNDFENIELNIIDICGKILFSINVNKIEKQIINYTKTNVPIYRNNKINDSPWEDFELEESFCFQINNLKSGIYFIDNKIKFIVKDITKEICLLYPSNTEAAYNNMGGKNLYYGLLENKKGPNFRSQVIGFHRTYLSSYKIDKHSMGLINWLYDQDYEINYICDSDLEENDNIINTKLFIITGHSEYWSKKMEVNLNKMIDSGVDVLNLSGNTIWWNIEFIDNKTKIVCIKDYKHISIKNNDFNCEKYIDTIQFNILEKNNNLYNPNIDSNFLNKQRPFFTLGVDYTIGGFGILSHEYKEHAINNYYSYDKNNVLLRNINNCIHVPSVEYDGIYLNIMDEQDNIYSPNVIKKNFEYNNLFTKNIDSLTLNKDLYSIFKYKQLIMIGDTLYGKQKIKRFTGIIAVKKNNITGIILNFGAMSWCSNFCFMSKYFGASSEDIKLLTKNAIDLLLSSKKMDIFNN